MLTVIQDALNSNKKGKPKVKSASGYESGPGNEGAGGPGSTRSSLKVQPPGGSPGAGGIRRSRVQERSSLTGNQQLLQPLGAGANQRKSVQSGGASNRGSLIEVGEGSQVPPEKLKKVNKNWQRAMQTAMQNQTTEDMARAAERENKAAQGGDPWRNIWEEKFVKEKRDVIKRHDFLASCSYGFTSAVIRKMTRVMFEANHIILKEGTASNIDKDDTLYILDGGEVEVIVGNRVVGILGGGTVFGGFVSMGILPEQSATVQTITPCRCYIIYRRDLQKLWNHFPEVQVALEEYLQEQWRLFNWVEWLRLIPLFQACDEDLLVDFELALDVHVFQEGEVAFESNSACDSLCILIRGRATVELIQQSADAGDSKKGVSLQEIGDCGTLGEMALLGVSSARTQQMRCLTPCTVALLRRKEFLECLSKFPAELRRFELLAAEKLEGSLDFGKVLQKVPFFSSSSTEFLYLVSLELTERKLMPGDTLIEERTPLGESLHILRKGTCFTSAKNKPSREVGEHTCFGQLAVLGVSGFHTETVQAKTICEILSLHRSRLLDALSHFPDESRYFRTFLEDKDIVDSDFEGRLRTPHLAELPVFKDCAEDFCATIAQCVEPKMFFPDQIMIEEGTEGDFLIILLSGGVTVAVHGRCVGEVPAPSCFGEMAVLGLSRRRTATIRARTICASQILNRPVLLRALESFPAERVRFEEMAAMRQEEITQQAVLCQLEDLEVFQGCDPVFLGQMSQALETRAYLPDQAIVSEGEEGESMFILHQGHAFAFAGGNKVGELSAGSVFGEMALLGIAKTRTATIKASSLCVVQLLHSEVMGEALETFPQERVKLEKVAEMRRRVLEAMANKEPEPGQEGGREGEVDPGTKSRAKARLVQALQAHMERYKKDPDIFEWVDPTEKIKIQPQTEREEQMIKEWLERRQKLISAKNKKIKDEQSRRPMHKRIGYRDFEEEEQERLAQPATASSIKRLQSTYAESCRPKDWIPPEWPPNQPWHLPAGAAGYTLPLPARQLPHSARSPGKPSSARSQGGERARSARPKTQNYDKEQKPKSNPPLSSLAQGL